MTISPEKLAQSWAAIYDGSAEAIDWIDRVRPTAPRLDSEADDLILSLRRVRNTASRLGGVSALPMTVGFFGLSQAGKSYLISTLAAGVNGKLETDFDGERLDFLTHVNPPGGGKEATGLVTRFSRTARPGPQGFPLELKLFSEVEVAKVLANSFFNDFNTEKVQYSFDEAAINQLLKTLEKRRQPGRVAGVSEDDVVSLWDYLQDSFPASLSALAGYYWPSVVKLAPSLKVEDRAQLFSIFWGEIPELTSAYLDFARTLNRLGNVACVYAPLESLVTQTDRGLSQADSIMNVDMLERLGRSNDSPISVCPFHDGTLGAPVSLSRAQLAALTAELVFPLAEPTSEPLFEQVDLLDFPGYRGRLAVESLDDVRRAVSNDEASPVAQLILRGKVAYLFERYTDSQEMNVLIVCTPANKQSDVTSVGPVLERWIHKTQGETPEQRALRKPGLLWAITMFDMRISSDLDKGEDLLSIGWGSGGMMKMTMLERFGQYSWLQEWIKDQPFANTFLVRKPRMKVPFLELQDSEEVAINPDSLASLDLMRRTFIADPVVQRHIAEPKDAWDAMLVLNDGGMARITSYLREVALREVKLQRIEEQLNDIRRLLEKRLGHLFIADGGELERKRQIARQISNTLWQRRPLLGELLRRMQLPDDLVRGLYLRADDLVEPQQAGSKPVEAAASALVIGDDFADEGFDLFGDDSKPAGSEASTPARTGGSDAGFAQAVLREWIGHLRHLPEDTRLMTFLGVDKSAIELLVDELISAALRTNLQNRLLQAIVSTEQIGTKREQLVGRQVLTAKTVLADFIAWLGFIDMPLEARPDSRVAQGRKLFQPLAELTENGLPRLPAQAVDHLGNYTKDWLVGVAAIAEGNVGHSAGREITPEQNEALGRVLATLNGANLE